MNESIGGVLTAFIVIGLSFGLYFLLLGWTVIGWIGSLIWGPARTVEEKT
jgi:hypothetical protein